jgi:glucose-1-phosphate adenylyltransferase
VPLAGKYRLVDIPISNCINSEINRIFLLTQFQTASLHRHIQTAYHFDAFGGGFVDILSAEQTEKSVDWYQGTADAVRRNLHHLRSFPHDYVLILSGDQLYRMDYRQLIGARRERRRCDDRGAAGGRFEGRGPGAPAGQRRPVHQPFVEKPKDPAVIASLALSSALETGLQTASGERRCLASMGIYLFNRGVLAEALDNHHHDFGKEIIPGLLGKKKLFAHIFEGYWEDIGTVRAFFEANLALTDPLPPFNFFDPAGPDLHAGALPSRLEAQSLLHRPCGDRRRFDHHQLHPPAQCARHPLVCG